MISGTSVMSFPVWVPDAYFFARILRFASRQERAVGDISPYDTSSLPFLIRIPDISAIRQFLSSSDLFSE